MKKRLLFAILCLTLGVTSIAFAAEKKSTKKSNDILSELGISEEDENIEETTKKVTKKSSTKKAETEETTTEAVEEKKEEVETTAAKKKSTTKKEETVVEENKVEEAPAKKPAAPKEYVDPSTTKNITDETGLARLAEILGKNKPYAVTYLNHTKIEDGSYYVYLQSTDKWRNGRWQVDIYPLASGYSIKEGYDSWFTICNAQKQIIGIAQAKKTW